MTTLHGQGPSRESPSGSRPDTVSPDAGFDRRWTDWIEKGRVRNTRLQDRARVFGVLVAAAVLVAMIGMALRPSVVL
jgi:hypothetical protein